MLKSALSDRIAILAPLLALALLVPPSPAAAQGGGLFVRVTSADGPVAGAAIELFEGQRRLLGTSTDSAGIARLVGITPGTYRVRVEAIGYRVRLMEEVVVAAGRAQIMTVDLETAPVEITGVNVAADARVQIQRENTDFATTVDEKAIEFLPVAYDANQLVGLTTGARAGHVWGGANFQANSYQIDGLSANHPGLGGSLIEPSTNWIERVEIRGLGAGAEHGGFQGGQVNVITKRGSNDFSAMLRSSTENDVLSASNLVATEIGSEVTGRYDIEGEVRGAVVEDRLFYYLGGTWVDRTARVLNHLNNVDGRYSPLHEERSDRKAFGKITWRPWTADEIELSGSWLNTTVDNYDMTGYEAAGASTRYSAPTWFANLAWRHSFGDWGNLEARINHFDRDERQDPYNGDAQPGVRLFALTPPYTAFGNAPYTLRSAPSSTSATLTNTIRLRTGEQEHLIRFGGEYTRGAFLDRRSRNGGMTWFPVRTHRFEPEDPATWSHLSSSFIPTGWGGEVNLNADVVNAAAFVQTSFSLGRLVLSPGLRWGLWEGYVDPNEGERFRAVHDQALDPRVGATLELTRDRSLVVKGHWGRYHQSMISQMFDRAAGTDVFTNEEIWYYRGDAPLDPAHRFTEAERDALAEQGLFTRESVVSLNETGPVVDYDQPYIDQWLVGVEKQFGGSVKIETLFTRRTNHDMIALVDRNRATNYLRYERVRVLDSGGMPLPYAGGSVVLEEIYVPTYVAVEELKFCAANRDVCGAPPGLSFSDTLSLTWNPDYVLTNAPDGRREFNQFQTTVEVARPTWGGSFSIAVTGLEGNLDNVSGYVDPEEFSPGPYVRVNEGVNAFGALPNFSEREAKVSAWGSLPWQLRGGLFWTYRSGDHYSPRFRLSGLGFYRYQANAVAMKGGNFRNTGTAASGDALPQSFFTPLEGHHVFVGPRGQPMLQRRSNLDFRLERMFELDRYDIGFALDVFNVLGEEAITEVQTLVNHGRNFYYFLNQTSSGLPWARTPANQYFKAVLDRVPPRTVRLGATVYF